MRPFPLAISGEAGDGRGTGGPPVPPMPLGAAMTVTCGGPREMPELKQMQEVVRDIQAEGAGEFGDWRARVLYCVGFFTLLLVAVIAARWLS